MRFFEANIMLKGVLFLLLCLSSCIKEKHVDDYEFHFDSSNVERYKDILSRVNKDYPHDFRLLKSIGLDEEIWRWIQNEDKILEDSVAYHEAVYEFMNLDIEVLHWLMSFKYDTIIDSNAYSPFFFEYHSPINSVMTICSGYDKRSPSRHAINYIFGYLSGGKGISCAENYSVEQTAAICQYEEVEQFLKLSRDLSIAEKRQVWRFLQKQKLLNRIFIFRFVGYSG